MSFNILPRNRIKDLPKKRPLHSVVSLIPMQHKKV